MLRHNITIGDRNAFRYINTMRANNSYIISRDDYRPYPYSVSQVRLTFDLDHEATRVHAEMDIVRNSTEPQPLVLNGQELTLLGIALDGRPLSSHEYDVVDDVLTLHPDPSSFTLTIATECHPARNTALMGLYASSDSLFTQCEAEGFRRITWFPDRPDVMTHYRVTLRADKTRYPVLLSNGNLISAQELDDGRHEAVWDDPHPKPSYLFALVAGQFSCREKTVSTQSGRSVLLQVYSDPGTEDKTAWALECLERAMRWDEDTFGLELDLDRFMIVAARDFNMGAMENKGLNIFNATYVLASPDTATDATYRTIEAIIGHEYFHNWTGNRVTCRDWFQLSLKEGLTVFREQAFSADMLAHGLDGSAADSARAVKRIEDVDILRGNQFPEDSGPMAHPIRPESYHEISNFYTATIYEKGAEVIRMLHTLLGPEDFRKGLTEYFARHDGQAVTCDDFLDAMECVYRQHHPDKNLDTFRRWYQQAGTPRVSLTVDYNAERQHCTLTLSQSNEPVGIEKQQSPIRAKPPLHIPVSIGFLNPDGTPAAAPHNGTTVLELTENTQSWSFDNITQRPVISRLRAFSAPVIFEDQCSDADRVLLAKHDPDPFARWEAIQELASVEILRHIAVNGNKTESNLAVTPSQDIVDVWHQLLVDPTLAADYRTSALRLISKKQMLSKMTPIDPVAISQAHDQVHAQLGKALADTWLDTYLSLNDVASQAYSPDAVGAGKRALRSLALGYLLAAGHPRAQDLAMTQYHSANNLTDRLGALSALMRYAAPCASTDILAHFYTHAQRDAQVMDIWFSVQANAHWASVESIETLMKHPEFSLRNPNRTRSVVFQFCLNNFAGIHTPQGYQFWAQQILALDHLNPEIAARLTRGLDNWAQFAEPARTGMRKALETVRAYTPLSPNVSEIVDKALTI